MMAFISPVLLEPSKGTRTERVQSFANSKRSLKGAVLTLICSKYLTRWVVGPTVRLLGQEPYV